MVLSDAGRVATKSRVDGAAHATRLDYSLLKRACVNVTERVYTSAFGIVPCYVVKLRLNAWRAVDRLIAALWCPRRSACPCSVEKLAKLAVLPWKQKKKENQIKKTYLRERREFARKALLPWLEWRGTAHVVVLGAC